MLSNNKFGQLGHGSWINKSLPKPINFLLGFNNDKVQFEEISCGGFHSLCLIKYKEDLSWIEDDFKAIVDTINSNDNIITSNLNFEDLLKHYQYDRKEKSNISKAKRLVERIDILTDKYTLVGKNMRRF